MTPDLLVDVYDARNGTYLAEGASLAALCADRPEAHEHAVGELSRATIAEVELPGAGRCLLRPTLRLGRAT